jgi:hypothetical protein
VAQVDRIRAVAVVVALTGTVAVAASGARTGGHHPVRHPTLGKDAAALSQAHEARAMPRPAPSARPGSSFALIQADRIAGLVGAADAWRLVAESLFAPDQLPDRYRGAPILDGTIQLLDLRRALPTLPAGPDRREIERLLTPTSGSFTCAAYRVPLPHAHSTAHFLIRYGTLHGLTIAQYSAALELAWHTEVSTFGWAAPPGYPPNPVPGGKYPVRIQSLTTAAGITDDKGTHAGPVSDNPNTPWRGRASASCIVLANSLSGFGYPPNELLKVTAAHEFNHALQFGYGAIGQSVDEEPDDNFVEGMATVMEDEVVDGANQLYEYLWPQFTKSMGAHPVSGTEEYAYWLIWRAMIEPYGTTRPAGAEQVLQDFWASAGRGREEFPALDAALPGSTTIGKAYHAAAIAIRFLHACTGGFAYPYCLEEGPAYMRKAGSFPATGSVQFGHPYQGHIQDDYTLNWIKLPASSSPYTVTLKNTGPGQLRGTAACVTGTGLRRVALGALLGPNQTGDGSFLQKGCQGNAYAVITNEHTTSGNPDTSPLRPYTLEVQGALHGNITWTYTMTDTDVADEIDIVTSATEQGSMHLELKRDPAFDATFKLLDDGSTFEYTYSATRSGTSGDCSIDGQQTGSGSGAFATYTDGSRSSSLEADVIPSFDPPAIDEHTRWLQVLAFIPFVATGSTTSVCRDGTVVEPWNTPAASGPFWFLFSANWECVPAGTDTSSGPPPGGQWLVGRWDNDIHTFTFDCSEQLDDGNHLSGSLSISGSVVSGA